MLRCRALSVLVVLAALGALSLPASAQSTVPSFSDRVVPEPTERFTYIGFEEFGGYLEDLEARYPRFVTVGSMGSSEQGRDLVTLELTDAASDIAPENRGVVYLSQGIHANEPGGREGMLRLAEDLLVEAAAGDEETLRALGSLRLVQAVTNVDSWASGDLRIGALPRYFRENADGVDLNRQLPWPGRVAASRDFQNQAESRAMVADADARRAAGERVVGTADVHGMIQDQSAVWTMFSSGQFDLGGWVRQIEMAGAIDREVRDALGPIDLLGETTAGLGSQLLTAHRTTTSSEFQGGLSGSGFYGDWLAQPEGLDSPSVSTIELFFNNGPAGTYNQLTYVPAIVQVHVDSVRAIGRAMIDTALVEHEVSLRAPGPVGVVEDPTAIEVPDVSTRRTADDTVTPMRFFDDLDPFLDQATVRIDPGDVTDQALAGLSVLVVSSDAALDDPAAAEALQRFAAQGGTLVLTDSGLRALAASDERFDPDDVRESLTMIGNATFTDTDHPLADGVRTGDFEETLHTYEPSTLGYNTEGAGGQAPVWHVDADAWEAAGGATVATTDGGVSIGELMVGDGTVRVIGGLLPPPTLQHDPRYGLANYAPNDTGYLVFANALGASLEITEVPAVFGPEETEDPDGSRRPEHAGEPGRPGHAGTPGPPPHRPAGRDR